MSYTIVGVIGHIDHGKTSLVRALTGTDTDTHPEEKRRGITIDLGFAAVRDGDREFAFIDAPGHQKYIGNLLAGVSAVDVGLLVVACDQGIQQQTLEHASILQMLGVPKLIVAISRIDLSTEDALHELTEELEVFLADFGFSDFPIVPLSSVTGEGLDELRNALRQAARTSLRSADGFFRMPIDRVFSVPGRGCVVAGTIWSGTVGIGDTLEWRPAGAAAQAPANVRVRELEVHGESVTKSVVGRRTAMNVTGVDTHLVKRGDELVAPGLFPVSRNLIVEIRTFADAPSLRCPATVQLHTATTADSARISGIKRLEAGQQVIAFVETQYPVVATFGQKVLLRLPYPIGSFGGGRVLAVLDSGIRQKRRMLDDALPLGDADPAIRLAALVQLDGEVDVDPIRFELQLGIPSRSCDEIVEQTVALKSVLMPVEGRLVSRAAADRVRSRALALLAQQAEDSPNAWCVEASLIQQLRPLGSAGIVQWALRSLQDENLVVRLGSLLALSTGENALSKRQRSRLDQIVEMFRGNRASPTTKEIANKLEISTDAVASLIRFAVEQRIVIDVGGGFMISADTFRELCGELKLLFDEQPERSVADIRDCWQVTRKHAIPFLEYCDRIGVTQRSGDVRMAGPQLMEFVPEQSVEQR
ncbi:MAG: selenocysteine-specific translation elongation factor [Planctomycetaceae bacterium]